MSWAVRPLVADDVVAADALNHHVWGGERRTPEEQHGGRRWIAHLIDEDPGGAWGVERHGRLLGVGIALMREGLWGLSLLVVDPDARSDGIGRALLEQALAYPSNPRGPGLIVSSSDPRALRAYGRAGFSLLITALAEAPEDESVKARFMTAEQGWAIELALSARLELEAAGALCIRGHPGPLAPYLPSGAYL